MFDFLKIYQALRSSICHRDLKQLNMFKVKELNLYSQFDLAYMDETSLIIYSYNFPT